MTDHDRLDPPPDPPGERMATPPPPIAAASPAPASSTSGAPVRGGVAIVGIVALLAVVAIIVWGGGERSTVALGGPAGPSGGAGAPIATGENLGGGQSGPVASGQPGSGTSPDSDPAPTFEAAPLDPAQIAPAALLVDDPELAGVGYEWRLPGRVDSVSQRFLDVFPQPGYEMKGGLGADHPSGQTTYVYTVNLTDDLSTGPVGTMYFLADPADPQGQTRVGLKAGR